MPVTYEIAREAIAKALYDAYRDNTGLGLGLWPALSEWQRDLARKQADAVIDTITELYKEHGDENGNP